MKAKRMIITVSILFALISLSGCGNNKGKSEVGMSEEVTTVTTVTKPDILVQNREMISVDEENQTETFYEEVSKEETKVLQKQQSVIVDDSEKSIHFGVDKNTDYDLSIINICGNDVDISNLDYDTLIENAHLQKVNDYDIIKEDKDFKFTAYAYSKGTLEEGTVGNVFNLVTENNGIINPDNPKTINTFILNRVWDEFPESIDVDSDVPIKLLGKVDWQKTVTFKSIKKILGEGTEHNGFICYNDGTTTMLVEGSDVVHKIYFYENSTINAQ